MVITIFLDIPLQDGVFLKTPILDESVENGARDRGLVRASASWSLLETWETRSWPEVTWLRMKWQSRARCFILEWKQGWHIDRWHLHCHSKSLVWMIPWDQVHQWENTTNEFLRKCWLWLDTRLRSTRVQHLVASVKINKLGFVPSIRCKLG